MNMYKLSEQEFAPKPQLNYATHEQIDYKRHPKRMIGQH